MRSSEGVLHGVFRDPFWPHQKLRQRVFQMQRGCQAGDQAGRDPDRREVLHIVLEVIPVCVAEEGKCAQDKGRLLFRASVRHFQRLSREDRVHRRGKYRRSCRRRASGSSAQRLRQDVPRFSFHHQFRRGIGRFHALDWHLDVFRGQRGSFQNWQLNSRSVKIRQGKFAGYRATGNLAMHLHCCTRLCLRDIDQLECNIWRQHKQAHCKSYS